MNQRKRILPIDELNALPDRIANDFNESGVIKSRAAVDHILDELLDIFLLALTNGIDSVYESLGKGAALTNGIDSVYESTGKDVALDAKTVQNIVYERVGDATWHDRIEAWYRAGGTLADVQRVAETEAHRIGNEAAYTVAVQLGLKNKTWLTMLDDRVRETHEYLESVTVPIDAEFFTFDGDHAMYPGGFADVENNANCRCEITFT